MFFLGFEIKWLGLKKRNIKKWFKQKGRNYAMHQYMKTYGSKLRKAKEIVDEIMGPRSQEKKQRIFSQEEKQRILKQLYDIKDKKI